MGEECSFPNAVSRLRDDNAVCGLRWVVGGIVVIVTMCCVEK